MLTLHFTQYDIIKDVLLEDIKLYPSSQCLGYQGIYFKSWIGYALPLGLDQY